MNILGVLSSFLRRCQPGRSISLSTFQFKYLVNCPEKSAFLFTHPKGVAKVEYASLNGVLDLQHTEIPEALRGMGIGKVVAQEVLDYCLTNKIKVQLTCEFLQGFYARNPQFKEIVVKS